MSSPDNYKSDRYRIDTPSYPRFIVAQTQIMIDLFSKIDRLAQAGTTVLIRGETGTGKELVALALHYNGPRKTTGSFVAVNCSGIPYDLLESILFGHVKGSFTGAYRDQKGQFEAANGGTIFLDEIGDMNPYLQAKILRAIQEREITPVGSHTTRKIDVRLVATTNRNLEDRVRSGDFRADLYYRLNVVPLYIPPLRNRKGDIRFISNFIISRRNGSKQENSLKLTEEAYARLVKHNWPGNVRELENVFERLFLQRKYGEVRETDLEFDETTMQVDKRVNPFGFYLKARLGEICQDVAWLSSSTGIDFYVINGMLKGNFLPDMIQSQKIAEALNIELRFMQSLLNESLVYGHPIQISY